MTQAIKRLKATAAAKGDVNKLKDAAKAEWPKFVKWAKDLKIEDEKFLKNEFDNCLNEGIAYINFDEASTTEAIKEFKKDLYNKKEIVPNWKVYTSVKKRAEEREANSVQPTGISEATKKNVAKFLQDQVKTAAPNKKIVAKLRELADQMEAITQDPAKVAKDLWPKANEALVKFAKKKVDPDMVGKDGQLQLNPDDLGDIMWDILGDNLSEKDYEKFDLLMVLAEDPLQFFHDELRDYL